MSERSSSSLHLTGTADVYISEFGVHVGPSDRLMGESLIRWYERALMRSGIAWLQQLGLRLALRRVWASGRIDG